MILKKKWIKMLVWDVIKLDKLSKLGWLKNKRIWLVVDICKIDFFFYKNVLMYLI